MKITIKTEVANGSGRTYEATDTIDINEPPDHPIVLVAASQKVAQTIEQIAYYIRKDEEKLQWEKSSNTP